MRNLFILTISLILFAGCNIIGSSDSEVLEQSEISILVINKIASSEIQAQVEQIHRSSILDKGQELYIFNTSQHEFEVDSSYRVIIELQDHWMLVDVVD